LLQGALPQRVFELYWPVAGADSFALSTAQPSAGAMRSSSAVVRPRSAVPVA
jgi:hypothetical protein